MNPKVKSVIKKLLFGTEIGRRLYATGGGIVRRARSTMSDEEYFLQSFYENNGFKLDLINPKTWNEKAVWISLHNRNPLKTKCADKYLVREYIAECGYESILNKLYGVYDSVDEIDFSKLPEKVFLRTNHDSGTYALISQNDTRRKEKLAKIEKALHRDYYKESREWQYEAILPKVLCEEYIETTSSFGLADYRFFCTYGSVLFVAVDIGTTSKDGKHLVDARRNIYTKDFIVMPDVKLKREHFREELIAKPANYDKMIEIAERLSKPFDQVRVDLYNIDGRIIFGELTFLCGGGMQVLEPYDFNLKMGEMIKI